MLQQQLWQQQKNIGYQFCDPKTEIEKVTEFHKKNPSVWMLLRKN